MERGEATAIPPASWRRALASWAPAVLAGAVLGALGLVTGWRLAGPTEVETPLGRASFAVAADAGGHVDAFVPIADWGIRADAFTAPFRLDFEVRSVDRRGALAAASGDRSLLSGLEDELAAAARGAVLRAFGWGLGLALALAVLVALARRDSARHRTAAITTASLALGASAVSLLAAWASFDARAFSSPSYYGRGQELAQLLAFFERQQGNERYSATFENALSNFSAYLSDAPRPAEEPGPSLLFASDLHNNALVLPALARFVEDQPVLLAGDFAHAGNEAEARAIAPRIGALGKQVVAVSGNHDSTGMMRALARAGVTVLGRNGRITPAGGERGSPVVRVEGLDVAGFPDPLEWRGDDPDNPERVFSFPELDEGEALEEEAKAELVAWFRSLPRVPDIVLVHQNALAQHLASELRSAGRSEPLTIVTGHNHYQHVDRHGPITVANAGTLGAGGALRVGQERVGLGRLQYAGPDAALSSLDFISVEPLSGQAYADRVILDVVCPPGDDAEEPCHYEPEADG